MTPNDRNRFRISEEAALWLVRLQGEEAPSLHAQFVAWCRQSPLHVEEFLLARATLEGLHPIDGRLPIDLDALHAAATTSAVMPLHAREQVIERASELQHRRAGRRLKLAAAACLVALACAPIYWLAGPGHARSYETATGDQSTVKLADGSVLYLNAKSRAEVRYTESSRDILLKAGEALFVVARDAKRPFRVTVDQATIQAVGTQFNVRHDEGGTRVAVVEGAVRVLPSAGDAVGAVELHAGEEAKIARRKVVRASEPNIAKAVAWRSRRLMFQSDTLEDVAREFNRYESHRPIRLDGDAVRRRVVSGVFDADDPRPLIEFLEADPELTVTRSDREVVIRLR